MLPIVWTEQARTDLAEILAYLEEHSPAAADRLAATIDQRCELLSQLPQMGRSREELSPGLRSIVVDNYVLFYRVTPNSIEIFRILHGARDIDNLMSQEGNGSTP